MLPSRCKVASVIGNRARVSFIFSVTGLALVGVVDGVGVPDVGVDIGLVVVVDVEGIEVVVSTISSNQLSTCAVPGISLSTIVVALA